MSNYFNTTLVRLKQREDKPMSEPQSYFNTTLVRLKREFDNLDCVVSNTFQYYFSPIETIHFKAKSGSKILISILL